MSSCCSTRIYGFWPRSVFAFLAAAAVVNAEQIQFSKPAVEIAAPVQGEHFLPATKEERLQFETPAMAPPVIMPEPAIIRRGSRDEEEDVNERSSFRNGRLQAARPNGRNSETTLLRRRSDSGRRDALSPDSYEQMRANKDKFSLDRPENSKALAPVTDLGWDGRDSQKSRSPSSGWMGRDNGKEGEPDAKRPILPFTFGREEEEMRNNGFKSGRLTGWFGEETKAKAAQEVLGRRAAFEQLLNPGSGVAGRMASSLEPLPSLNESRAPIPGLTLPTIGQMKSDVRVTDPMQAFNAQQDRLRGPALDDPNRKYAQPAAAPAPAASTASSRFQTPLNRQPTAREFPSRRF
jgi:hypothetical protein